MGHHCIGTYTLPVIPCLHLMFSELHPHTPPQTNSHTSSPVLRHMQEFRLQHSCSTSSSTAAHLAEPSALDGILSERFCCGPELTSTQQQDPYYSSELGQVFFPPNAWPHQLLPELQPHMLQCYSQCGVIAAALMRLFAAALGMDPHHFDASLTRHHSNMQVCRRHSTLKLEVSQHRQLQPFREPTRGALGNSHAKHRHKTQ